MNNLYVVTGPPSSGKTTTLRYLEQNGYNIAYEQARYYIDQQMKLGKTLADIRGNEYLFQKNVLDLKINFEQQLPNDEIIFIERGIPDTIAYYKLCGVLYDYMLHEALKKSYYKKVFLFQLVEFKKDYARTEDETLARRIEYLLEESYTSHGFSLVKVPPMPIEERAQFVLQNL